MTSAERFGVKVGDVWMFPNKGDQGQTIRVLAVDLDNKNPIAIAYRFLDEKEGKEGLSSTTLKGFNCRACFLLSRNGKPVPQPGEWITGQEWVDLGGDEKEFRERWLALHDDGEVAQAKSGVLWVTWHAITGEDPKCEGELCHARIRLRLTDTQDLPPVPEKGMYIDGEHYDSQGNYAPEDDDDEWEMCEREANAQCRMRPENSRADWGQWGEITCETEMEGWEYQYRRRKQRKPKIHRLEIIRDGAHDEVRLPWANNHKAAVHKLAYKRKIHGYVYAETGKHSSFCSSAPWDYEKKNGTRDIYLAPKDSEIINGDVIRILPVAVLVEE